MAYFIHLKTQIFKNDSFLLQLQLHGIKKIFKNAASEAQGVKRGESESGIPTNVENDKKYSDVVQVRIN